MKVWKHLSPENIHLSVPLPDKDAVLRFIAESLGRDGRVRDTEHIYRALKTREDSMTTGIGNGIAIPHALVGDIDHIIIILMRLAGRIPYESIDGRPVDVVISLIVPENETTLHLNTLAGISGLCRRPDFLRQVRKARSSQDLLTWIKHTEESGAAG